MQSEFSLKTQKKLLKLIRFKNSRTSESTTTYSPFSKKQNFGGKLVSSKLLVESSLSGSLAGTKLFKNNRVSVKQLSTIFNLLEIFQQLFVISFSR